MLDSMLRLKAAINCAIGENLVARRAEDVAVAARHFCKMTGSKQIALSVTGVAAIPAAHAFFLERSWFESFETKSAPLHGAKLSKIPKYRFILPILSTELCAYTIGSNSFNHAGETCGTIGHEREHSSWGRFASPEKMMNLQILRRWTWGCQH